MSLVKSSHIEEVASCGTPVRPLDALALLILLVAQLVEFVHLVLVEGGHGDHHLSDAVLLGSILHELVHAILEVVLIFSSLVSTSFT